MGIIQDNELVLYKAVAEHIKSGLLKPLKKLNVKCNSELLKFEKQKSKFMTSETYEDLGDSSKGFKTGKEELISLLAIQDRLDKMLSRNERRIEFISSRLGQMGIYNDAVDKKSLMGAISAEKENVSEESLNLNPGASGGVTFEYFAGEILAFRDGELDFSLKENREILVSGSSELIHEIVETFPYSVATIPNAFYIIPNVKIRILRECILYVASKIKTQSIAESNRELGGLLENVAEISSFNQFVNELKNYFNVIVKGYLKKKLPEDANEIDEEIICNETSIFLPKEMRNFGGKVQPKKEETKPEKVSETEKPETLFNEEKSETEFKEEKSETETSSDDVSRDYLLDLLLNDDADSSSVESSEKPDSESEDKSNLEDDIEQTLRELEALLKMESDDDEDDKKED